MKDSSYKKIGQGLAGATVLVLIFLMVSSYNNNDPDNSKPVPETSKSKEKVLLKGADTQWTYNTSNNPIDGIVRFAYCSADQVLTFKFPYDGGSVPTLTLQKSKNKTVLYLTVSKGQFMTSEGVVIKLDKNRAHSYPCSYPTDGSSNTIFIYESGPLIRKIKNTKELVIKATFYQEGDRTMIFGTEGLKF